jgi:hypothetical protein
MKTLLGILIAGCLVACANTPLEVYKHPRRVDVNIDDIVVAVSPGERPGEYNALRVDSFISGPPQMATLQSRLVRGIEKVTNCKVTSAVFVPGTVMISSLVAC